MFLKELEQWPVLHLPKTFLQKYPSFIEIRWRNSIQEAAWVRRLFQCVASALTLNGKFFNLRNNLIKSLFNHF